MLMSSKLNISGPKEQERAALVPKLRFPEFQDAEGWDEKTFGQLLDDIIDFRGRTPIKLGMEWGNGNITSLSANNVKNGFIDYRAECNLGSEELYQHWMGNVSLEKDDIVFTMEAPLGNALLLPDSQKYILSQRVVAFKTNLQVLNPFLVQLIWSEGFQDAINELSAGSTAKGINQKALKTVLLRIPQRKEQQRIADCLSSVDELMAAQARKVDALKTHKKGLMQQLFPRKGESQPRLRFPEFQNAGEWDVRSIGEMFRLINGFAFKPEEWKPSGTPIIRIQNLNDPSAEFNYSQAPVPERNRIESGDLLFAWSGTLGSSFGARVWNGPSGVLNQHIFKVLVDQQLITLPFSLLVLARVEENIAKKTHGFKASFVHVKKSDLVKVELLLPSLPEQQRIATCLSSLDALTTAETQKLDALKTHKQGLMQQLFPTPEEHTP